MSRAVAIVRGALVVALLVLPVTVAADARTEARRHFRRGMELVVEGNVDGGVAELELAYEILPHRPVHGDTLGPLLTPHTRTSLRYTTARIALCIGAIRRARS